MEERLVYVKTITHQCWKTPSKKSTDVAVKCSVAKNIWLVRVILKYRAQRFLLWLFEKGYKVNISKTDKFTPSNATLIIDILKSTKNSYRTFETNIFHLNVTYRLIVHNLYISVYLYFFLVFDCAYTHTLWVFTYTITYLYPTTTFEKIKILFQ